MHRRTDNTAGTNSPSGGTVTVTVTISSFDAALSFDAPLLIEGCTYNYISANGRYEALSSHTPLLQRVMIAICKIPSRINSISVTQNERGTKLELNRSKLVTEEWLRKRLEAAFRTLDRPVVIKFS